MGKVLLIASIVITAATAALGFINHGTLVTTKKNLEETTANLTKTSATLAKTESTLKTTTENLTTTTAEKEKITAQAEALKVDVNKAKAEVTDLTAQITAKTSEVEKLTADIATVQGELDAMKTGNQSQTSDPSSEMQIKIQENETLINKLQGDLKTSRDQLEALNKEKQDRMALKMQNGLEGRIQVVNQAWNFVVIDLGDRKGVVNNAELLIKRGTSLIGKIRVTSVDPMSAIADIVPNSVPRGMTIQPGDHVIYQATND